MARIFTIEGQRLVFSNCITCGVLYAVPEPMWNEQQKFGGSHTCTNGHSQGWDKGQSEFGRLKRERDRLAQRVAEKDDAIRLANSAKKSAERTAAAYKGQTTKLKRRAKAGVCACCNRTFQNLAQHMKSKHPNFGPDEPLKVIEGGKG